MAHGAGRRAPRAVMLLENNTYPADVRVQSEAESLSRAGYGITVIAPRGPGEPRREAVRGVSVLRYWLPVMPATVAGFLAEYLLANIQLQSRGCIALLRGANVLHLHNPPDTLFPLALLARALGRRVIFDHHDLTPELFAAKFESKALGRVLALFERATFRLADTVLAPNESHRTIATTRGEVPPDRVFVVRNGPRSSMVERAMPGRPGRLDDPHLLFLGTLGGQDGVDLLPHLISRLRNEEGLPGVHLTIVGDGARRHALEQAVAAKGLSDCVTFTGRVPHQDLPPYLAAADICLDPAPPTEINRLSTMTKIAEYMAAGRPTVSFDLLETRRTAGEAALYAGDESLEAFARLVAQLAADGRLREQLRATARDRVADLTWDHSERALLDAYKATYPLASQRA